MRKITLLALAVGCVAYAGAKIEWNKSRHDFGAFNESEGPQTATFTYRNVGDEPLVVTGARANCGCTTPQVSAEILQPGDTATLVVTYDPQGHAGRFEKRVYIDTNTEPARSTLVICGTSVGSPTTVSGRYPVEVGPLRLAHPAVLLGNINRGKIKSVYESAYNASTDTLRPVVTDTPRWLSVKTVPEVVPPGEQVGFNYFISSLEIPEWDFVTDTVTLRPDPASDVEIRLPVVITVNEDFSRLSPKEIAQAPAIAIDTPKLQPLQVSGDRPATTSFTITNTGQSPLKIRRIYTRTPGVTTDIKASETIKPGKSRKVRVTVAPGVLDAQNVATVVLSVVSNDPFNPKTTVAIPLTR